MKLLVVLVSLAAVAALPRKLSKNVLKKYDPATHGLKDTYSLYSHAHDEDLVVPAPSPFIDTLLPPSSYDLFSDHGPMDAILPPAGSTYTGLTGEAKNVAMVPPPADTYSSPDGVALADLAPPPAVLPATDGSSYLAYSGLAQEPLEAPEMSSYAQVEAHSTGHEVLASLAAMAKALPHTSSYARYQDQKAPHGTEGSPAANLRPPSAHDSPAPPHSSYSEVEAAPPALTAGQMKAAQEAGVQVPATGLLQPLQ